MALTRLQEELDGLGGLGEGGEVEGGLPPGVARVDVGAALNQVLHGLGVPILTRRVRVSVNVVL